MAGWHHRLDGHEFWVNSGSWWWTGRPGVLQYMGSQRVRHDWTELNWWRPTRPSRTNTKKRCPFHHRGLECKSRNSDPSSNRQVWPWSTKWSRAKANRVLPRERTAHSKHPLQWHKRRLYTWTSPEIRLIIFFAAKDGEAIYSQQKQDQELTVAQIMNSLNITGRIQKCRILYMYY